MAYVQPAPAAVPTSMARPHGLVIETVCDVTEQEIDMLSLQDPILINGVAGSSAAIWAVLSPGCIRVLGPQDCSATPRDMAWHAQQAAEKVSEKAGREIVNMGYDFFQVAHFAPNAEAMRPDVDHSRRRRRHVAGGSALASRSAGSSASHSAGSSALTLAQRKANIQSEADASGTIQIRKKLK